MVNRPFEVHFNVFDNLNQPATNLMNVKFSILPPSTSDTILNSMPPLGSSSFGTYTFGYQFTPSTDLIVTKARTFGGTKVSIWSTNQELLASVPVSNRTGAWSNTPFTTPILLKAGTSYIVGVYTAGNPYAWGATALPATFSHGTIDSACYTSTDEFPLRVASRLYFVDLVYTIKSPINVSVTPATFNGLVAGGWTGSMTIDGEASGICLVVDDGFGHVATSNPFDVVAGGPQLTATLVNGNIVLSWPVTASGYVLEYTSSLNGNWSTVSETPTSDGTIYSVTHSANGIRFYRLRK
jgi:hypothetical protein